MPLDERVFVARRFQRAVRIDTDLGDPSALEGFICPQSSAVVLETMAKHVAESGQGAFTWTGPYGSGKSSLVVALSSLLHGESAIRSEAGSVIGGDTAKAVWEAFPPRTKGWHILPVVGRRDHPERLIREAIETQRLMKRKRRASWSEKPVFALLSDIAARDSQASGGLMVFIDEMGKVLEGATRDGSDVYFLQQLAEMASRSEGRLIVVGILHQAFEEYAHRLSREMREEWSKIQGRFVDLPVNTAADEQIGLLGRAIESDHNPAEPAALSKVVAALTHRATSEDLPQLLEDCWPLHPVVSCLLGPISRRRFGQNQRSIFGFLNSSEPSGFQDFLRRADDGDLYTTDLLWDYLRFNLEPSIMASPDGHRWALAVEALERCQALGGDELQLLLLKTIALLDLFKERSGLVASVEALRLALPTYPSGQIQIALDQSQAWSLIIHRKFNDSYSVFEGSDFDIDDAVGRVLEATDDVDFIRLNAIADLQPIVAKRHYHETGALRWFDVAIAPLADAKSAADDYHPQNGSVGTFLLAVPTQGESTDQIQQTAQCAVDGIKEWDLVIGVPQETWNFTSLVRELLAIEQVRDESPELQGDRVARREIEARVSALRGLIESELNQAFGAALWYAKDCPPECFTEAELNGLASDLAGRRFHASPRLNNELLNRVKPSSNAVAARNVLLRKMAMNEGQERLGIDGFPAEGGLFASLLEATSLYRQTSDGWRFVDPTLEGNDPCNLSPAWREATAFLESSMQRTVSVAEIYDIWRSPPFGIKEGLLPVLAVAFIQSMRRQLAFYRQNVFQARVTDLDVDYLAKDSADVQLRWMDLSDRSRDLLSDMAGIVRALDKENILTDLEPIDVAKGLVAIHDRLPPWVGRTQGLSANAKRVRQLFKQASDPNRLIFDDIPQLLSDGIVPVREGTLHDISDNVREGLTELQQAYPAMLHRLRETLLAELQVPNASAPMLGELRARAENIRELGGDHRIEAFLIRLAQFTGTDEDMEGLASLAVNKPPRNWVDTDIDRATVELAEMAQRFMRVEAYAHVKGRSNKRHSMAVTVGMSGRPTTIHDEFDVLSLDRPQVDALISEMHRALKDSGEERRSIILAALAELSAHYLTGTSGDNMDDVTANREAVGYGR